MYHAPSEYVSIMMFRSLRSHTTVTVVVTVTGMGLMPVLPLRMS
jgi:hypothetical protein